MASTDNHPISSKPSRNSWPNKVAKVEIRYCSTPSPHTHEAIFIFPARVPLRPVQMLCQGIYRGHLQYGVSSSMSTTQSQLSGFFDIVISLSLSSFSYINSGSVEFPKSLFSGVDVKSCRCVQARALRKRRRWSRDGDSALPVLENIGRRRRGAEH